MKTLLNKCVPANDEEAETSIHNDTLTKIDMYKNDNVENKVTTDEIDAAMKLLKKDSAPGIDGFNSEIIQALWNSRPESISNVLNNCLLSGVFPKWKRAQLKIILKSKDKDKSQIGSYRPISLLPTMSKILERIILGRIQVNYRDAGLDDECQYGFKKGRSSDDAIQQLKNSIKSSMKKYVAAIFIDIQGAFDNLWWPAIKERVVRANCSTKQQLGTAIWQQLGTATGPRIIIFS